jgi:hypothetical protein
MKKNNKNKKGNKAKNKESINSALPPVGLVTTQKFQNPKKRKRKNQQNNVFLIYYYYENQPNHMIPAT